MCCRYRKTIFRALQWRYIGFRRAVANFPVLYAISCRVLSTRYRKFPTSEPYFPDVSMSISSSAWGAGSSVVVLYGVCRPFAFLRPYLSIVACTRAGWLRNIAPCVVYNTDHPRNSFGRPNHWTVYFLVNIPYNDSMSNVYWQQRANHPL